MARAYKGLYLQERAERIAAEARVAELLHWRNKARAALAAFGRAIVERPEFCPGGTEPITLPAHEYEALDAMLISCLRFLVGEAEIPTVASLMWRGHRVYCSRLVDPVLVG